MPIDHPGNAQAVLDADPYGRRRPAAPRKAWAAAIALVGALACGAAALAAESAAPTATFQGLDAEVQSLKQEVVDLNRDLFVLEEALLFPANSQVALFVSMDVGQFFALDSVVVLLDGKNVANYLYTPREVEALLRGGVHRLWVGNVKPGEHEMTAFLTGTGPGGRYYTRGATMRLEKHSGAKYLELKISDRAQSLQPEFVVREWE